MFKLAQIIRTWLNKLSTFIQKLLEETVFLKEMLLCLHEEYFAVQSIDVNMLERKIEEKTVLTKTLQHSEFLNALFVDVELQNNLKQNYPAEWKQFIFLIDKLKTTNVENGSLIHNYSHQTEKILDILYNKPNESLYDTQANTTDSPCSRIIIKI